MALKLLVPVLPSERFYDAVVAAGDLLASEGGTITFFFTKIRPPPFWEEKEDVGYEAEMEPDVALARDDREDTVEAWQDQMAAGLDEARDLLRERGVRDDQVTTLFGDMDASPAQAIADEAAAGAYDMVILPKQAIAAMPGELAGGAPTDIADAVKDLADDGVKLMVT
jgi:hypothetical protein